VGRGVHLAPPNGGAGHFNVLRGHLGPEHVSGVKVVGGSAWWNVTMLDDLFDFEEIRVTSRRPESRERFAARLAEELGKPVRAVATPAEAGPLGALRRHVDSGRLSRANLHAEPSRRSSMPDAHARAC
jgi:hypothetical protein